MRLPRLPIALVVIGACAPPQRATSREPVVTEPSPPTPSVASSTAPKIDCDAILSPPKVDPTPPEAAVTPSPAQNLATLPARGAIQPEGSFGSVANGSVFERGVVKLKGATRVVVPDNASVAFGAKAGEVELFMEKRLGYAGHPPERMPLNGLQRNMGCAMHADGSDLIVATFGEWDSRIEGSALLLLLVRVPEGTPVLRRRGLSGDRSVATAWPESVSWERQTQGRVGYWFAPTSVVKPFTIVQTTPDPLRSVASASPPAERFKQPFYDPGPSKGEIKGAIDCVIAKKKHELTACHDVDPSASGWFEVSGDTRADGTVARAEVYVGTLKDSPIASCVLRAIGKWSFPNRASGSFVERFELAPRSPR